MRPLVLLALAPALLAVAPTPPAVVKAPAPPAATNAAGPPDKPAAPTETPSQDKGPPALRVAIGPGAPRDALRTILLAPYARATGTALAEVAWDGGIEGLRKLQADHAADLVLVDGATLLAGCSAQLYEKLDWTRLGRARFLPVTTSDCGAGAAIGATALAWDRDKLPGSDPSWADFWDVAKHPGRRGLQHGARGNLEIALLADGVAPGEIYRTLRTADGLDRAFRKLDQLRPYLVWWDQPAQPAQLLGAAKVLLTSAPAAMIGDASVPGSPAGPHVRLGLQWTGSLNEVKSWVVPRDATHKDAAMAALVLATDPARAVDLARATGLGPTTADAAFLLPETLRAASPGVAANLRAGLAIDEAFWQDNHGVLEARFTAWLAK